MLTVADLKQDFYRVLGVADNASLADINKAYRAKALIAHPDKNPAVTAEEDFKKLQRAYEILSNSTSKMIYDLTRPVPKAATTKTATSTTDNQQQERQCKQEQEEKRQPQQQPEVSELELKNKIKEEIKRLKFCHFEDSMSRFFGAINLASGCIMLAEEKSWDISDMFKFKAQLPTDKTWTCFYIGKLNDYEQERHANAYRDDESALSPELQKRYAQALGAIAGAVNDLIMEWHSESRMGYR
jgi:hypothetical protein